MDTFDKMYGKACLQGQIVLHVDSSSGFKNEVDLLVSRVVFEKLCWKNRCNADRVFAQEKHYTKPLAQSSAPQMGKQSKPQTLLDLNRKGGHQPNSCPMVEYQGRGL